MTRATRTFSVLALVVLCASVLSAPAWAQQTTAELNGRVTDESGAVLPGVTVTATQTATGLERTAVTDGGGAYLITNLPPGLYVIVETQPGGILYDGFDTPGTLGGTTPSNDRLSVTLAPNDDG